MKECICRCVVCGKIFTAGSPSAQCCSQECRNKKPPLIVWEWDERPCDIRGCAKDTDPKKCASGCDAWKAWFVRRWRQIRRAAGIKERAGTPPETDGPDKK